MLQTSTIIKHKNVLQALLKAKSSNEKNIILQSLTNVQLRFVNAMIRDVIACKIDVASNKHYSKLDENYEKIQDFKKTAKHIYNAKK